LVIDGPDLLEVFGEADMGTNKQLGITATILGDTKSMKKSAKPTIKEKLFTMLVSRINAKTLRYCINTMICTTLSYAPLIVAYTPKEAREIDKVIKDHAK